MKITKIEPQKRNKNRFSVYLDDEFAFGIDDIDVLNLKLKEGMELTLEELEYIRDTVLIHKAQSYGLKLVSTHHYTQSGLQRKMKEKGYDDESIKKTIAFLQEYGYIDDRAFALQYIEDCINYKKYGKYRIESSLWEKGISKELISELLNEIDFEEVETENILPLVKQKLDGNFEYNNIMKVKRHFVAKGYSYGVIDTAIKKISNVDEEW